MSDFTKMAEKYAIAEPDGGWAAHDDRVAAQYAAEAGLELPDRLIGLGIPRRVHGPILNGYDVTRSVVALRDFYKGEKTIALLAGSPGCGKTLAASAWLLHAKPAGPTRYLKPRRFITAPEFCRISAFDREEYEAVEKAVLLVIDDLGEEYADKRAYFSGLFANLLSRRHGEMLPTVITSNLNVKTINEAYGARVESRLNDAMVLQLRGEKDLREAGE